MTEPTPLTTLLHNILAQEDIDTAYIIAGAINLYHESIKRRGARSMLLPDDIFRLLNIIQQLLAAGEVEQGVKELVGRRAVGR